MRFLSIVEMKEALAAINTTTGRVVAEVVTPMRDGFVTVHPVGWPRGENVVLAEKDITSAVAFEGASFSETRAIVIAQGKAYPGFLPPAVGWRKRP